MAPPKTETFPLVELIRALGNELRQAERLVEQDDEASVLALKDCSIELGVSWQRAASGEVSFYVFKLGGGVDRTNTQTITVNLEPARKGMRVGASVRVPRD
jgi:Trypsin-co-occurring domain 2